MKKCISVGGQALIEGIMMKSPEKAVLAVRAPDKSIVYEEINYTPLKDRIKFLGLPIIRGAVNFVESLIQGYKVLMRSAELSGFTELEEDKPKDKENKDNQSFLINIIMIIASVLGALLAVVLFMYLPALLFNFTNGLLGGGITPFRALFEGVLKIAIFIVYILLVSKTKDIKRVFMYHGAEHKAIFCYEADEELTVENVKKHSRFHPRCGTSFMVLMLVCGIIITFLVQTIFPAVTKNLYLWVAIKILMLPLICGIGYELIKICGKYQNKLTKAIAFPGLLVQRITTKEPDDDMCEIAIAALTSVLPQKDSEQI